MTCWARMALVYCAVPLAACSDDKAVSDSAAFRDFDRRVGDYIKLHKNALGDVHRLKPTESPEAIELHEHGLGRKIRDQRNGAGQGSIFTPPIAAEFRRLIAITMQGPEAARIRQSLQHAAPVQLKSIRVNHHYPDAVALQSTPPSLLLNLPQLPPELEYRVVGSSLVLRDVDANLIVDLIPNAIP